MFSVSYKSYRFYDNLAFAKQPIVVRTMQVCLPYLFAVVWPCKFGVDAAADQVNHSSQPNKNIEEVKNAMYIQEKLLSIRHN